MISVLYRIFDFVRRHKFAFGVGGGVVTVGVAVSLVKRKLAAGVGRKIVAKLEEQLGTPYIWGSRDPAKGLDCSGAVVWALRELGLEPKKYDATAADLHKQSSTVILPQAGDLAFYGSILGGISHVMVYMGDGKVIGASGGGPSTKTAADAKAKNAMVKVLPVNYRSDFRGYGRLPVQTVKDVAVGGLHMLGAR